jgi:hypothetical protein
VVALAAGPRSTTPGAATAAASAACPQHEDEAEEGIGPGEVIAFRGSRMLRILAGVLLLQLLAQATGVVYAVQEQACEDPASEGDEDCTPNCEDCLCCPHHRTVVPQIASEATLLPVRQLVYPGVDLFLNEPEPGDIMHVPKIGSAASSLKRA